MKIYHYTTIDALAMILSNRSIKFSRLDKVDDMEERVESQNVWESMRLSLVGRKIARNLFHFGKCTQVTIMVFV